MSAPSRQPKTTRHDATTVSGQHEPDQPEPVVDEDVSLGERDPACYDDPQGCVPYWDEDRDICSACRSTEIPNKILEARNRETRIKSQHPGLSL